MWGCRFLGGFGIPCWGTGGVGEREGAHEGRPYGEGMDSRLRLHGDGLSAGKTEGVGRVVGVQIPRGIRNDMLGDWVLVWGRAPTRDAPTGESG